jgi:hypothetical protein
VSVFWARDRTLGRVAGLVVIDRVISKPWRLKVDDLGSLIEGSEFARVDFSDTPGTRLMGIGFAWVLRKYRCLGLGLLLVETAIRTYGDELQAFAFQRRFTPDGARLLYRLARRRGADRVLVYA